MDVIFNNKDFNLNAFSYSTGIHSMYNGVNWLYTHIENTYMYDYNIIYF